MQYTIEEAKTKLSELIEKACNGEPVIIARGKKPLVKLVPVGAGVRKRVPGGYEGQFSWTPDAFDPLTEEEMRKLGFEFE